MQQKQGGCETCTYFTYDEDYECYVCDIDMDEDEYVRLMSDDHYNCPYYRNGDEYLVVRKQRERKAEKRLSQNHPTQVSKRQPLTKGRISIYFYLLYLSSEGIQ